jgi:hypothetical protein
VAVHRRYQRQRPSHWRVFRLSCPVHLFPGGGVMVLSHRERVLFHVWTARVPSSHRVCRRPSDLTSEVVQRTAPA